MKSQYINLISEKLKVSLEQAQEIFEKMMDDPEINFSELSTRQLIQEARITFESIQLTKGKSFEEIQRELMKLYGIK